MSITTLLQKDINSFKPFYVSGVHNALCTLYNIDPVAYKKGLSTVPENTNTDIRESTDNIIYNITKTLAGYIKLFEIYDVTIFDFSYYKCTNFDRENFKSWIKKVVSDTEEIQPKLHFTSSYLMLWDILLVSNAGNKILTNLLLDLLELHFVSEED